MPESDAIPDRHVLAAVRRAQLHSASPGGVTMRAVKAHLGLPHSGWTTRQLRPQIEALIAAGSLKPGRQNGLNVYALTLGGRRRAAPFRVLPESPQHRRWRVARAMAAKELAPFRAGVLAGAQQVREMVEAGETASQPWLTLRRLLERGCWRLASALHCLYEWPEPSDARPDRHAPQTEALRNVVLWSD